MSNVEIVEIIAPDDFHHHLRDNDTLGSVVKFAAASFQRIIVMPNLAPQPVRNLSDAIAYKHRILSFLPSDTQFLPMMTLYLTDMTTPADITEASQSQIVFACKLYPNGATTNSQFGVTNIHNIYPVLQVSILLYFFNKLFIIHFFF